MLHAIPPDRRLRIEQLGYDYAAQPKRAWDRCNLCGHDEFVILTHSDRYGFRASASACLRCGLVFLNPVMTGSAYGEFYARVYRPLVSAYHNRLIDARTVQDDQRPYAAALGEFLAPLWRPRPGGALLDVGGSTGIVAREVAGRFGLRGTVLDPAAAELDQARQLGLETVAGFLEDSVMRGRRFDLVLVCQTVDHFLDAAGSLAKVRELIQPDGWLFLDIVDFRAACLRNHSVEEAVKIDHPFYFTESTALTLLQRAGFRPVRRNYAADHLHVGFLCRPVEPQPGALPAAAEVASLLRELRYLQNAPR